MEQELMRQMLRGLKAGRLRTQWFKRLQFYLWLF